MRKLLFIFVISIFANAQDRGIGVVFFSLQGSTTSRFHSDSAFIYQYPYVDSYILATFKLIAALEWDGYSYSVFSKDSNFTIDTIEYGYEISGIPFDSMMESQTWVLIKNKLKGDNLPLHGWMKVKNSNMSFLLWENELVKNNLFFSPESAEPVFYDSPNGKREQFELIRFDNPQHRQYDYIMHPIEVQGQWMKVRVVSPSDYCHQPVSPKTKVLWIKYLDDKGHPLVFYYTRGC